MSDDKIIPFPRQMRDAISDEQWMELQGQFYLDCFMSAHEHPAESPEQLREWLQQAQVFADMENPFFRGWLLRRLSEPEQ